jgi:hypothetical protein
MADLATIYRHSGTNPVRGREIDTNNDNFVNFVNAIIAGTAVLVLPVYANNAAAITGGLVAGNLYRDNSNPDHVCIVH